MRRTAILIMLVGFVFALFSIPFRGIDLLIDAVGFLLVWNGLRALQKWEGTFGFGPACCLALVVVAALQLFFTGRAALPLALLRAAGEALLYWQLLGGFVKMGRREGRQIDVRFAVAALCASEAGLALRCAGLFLPGRVASVVVQVGGLLAAAVLILTMVRFSYVYGEK